MTIETRENTLSAYREAVTVSREIQPPGPNNGGGGLGLKLLDDQRRALDQMEAINAAAADREFDADEQAAWDLLQAETDATAAAIDTNLAAMERQRSMPAIRSFENPNYAGIEKPTRNRGDKSYAGMFGAVSPDGWQSSNEYLECLYSGLADGRLRGMVEGVGSDGGFVVPEQFLARWLDASLENEIIRPRCRVEAMETDTLKIAGFDASDNSGSAPFGGFTGTWLSEASAATDVNPSFRKIVLNAKKLAIFTKASSELIEDGVDFENQLGNALTLAIGWHLDVALLTGSGSGQPLGILNDPAVVEVSKEVGQTADSITYTNLAAMFSRLHPACVANSVWICNSTAIPQLLTLSIPAGTAGTHIPAMTESNGEFRMLTRPVIFTEKVPTLGDAGDIILTDLSQYTCGLRRGARLEKSTGPSWSTDETNFRMVLRSDGQGRWKSAFSPKNGSTLSWIVTLAERA